MHVCISHVCISHVYGLRMACAQVEAWYDVLHAAGVEGGLCKPGGGVKLKAVHTAATTAMQEAKAAEEAGGKALAELRKGAKREQVSFAAAAKEAAAAAAEAEIARQKALDDKKAAEDEARRACTPCMYAHVHPPHVYGMCTACAQARRAKLASFKRRKNVKETEKAAFEERVAARRATHQIAAPLDC